MERLIISKYLVTDERDYSYWKPNYITMITGGDATETMATEGDATDKSQYSKDDD